MKVFNAICMIVIVGFLLVFVLEKMEGRSMQKAEGDRNGDAHRVRYGKAYLFEPHLAWTRRCRKDEH
jgi:uncharacterized membrane protein